jgi:hypothetical protein
MGEKMPRAPSKPTVVESWANNNSNNKRGHLETTVGIVGMGEVAGMGGMGASDLHEMATSTIAT